MKAFLFFACAVSGIVSALLGNTSLTVLNMCMAIILYLGLNGGGIFMARKLGDKVAYLKYDTADWQSSLVVGFGFVFHIDKECVGCARYNHSLVYIKLNSDTETVVAVTDNTKGEFIDILNKEVGVLRENIKRLTHEEKNLMRVNKFEELKDKAISTAKSMCEANEDSRVINCIKEICQIKTQMYSIKIEDLENIHKRNGAIKYKLRQLERLIESVNKMDFEMGWCE